MQLSRSVKQRVRDRLGDAAERAAAKITHRHYLALEYAPSAANKPRWGYERPTHLRLRGLLAAEEEAYRQAIDMILRYSKGLAAISSRGTPVSDARWDNGNLPGLDGAAIYAFVRGRRPSTYLEIGSGNSTKFAARAIRDGQLPTRLASIDPHPRAEIDRLCDDVYRQPLETADLTPFWELQPNDIVFFDGSHRAFMNSDVTVFFLDILPRLPAGVLVGIHDIVLPDDYPDHQANRYWSEQYLLAAFLLGGGRGTQIILPSWYISAHSRLASDLEPLWDCLPPVERHGGAFWLQTVE